MTVLRIEENSQVTGSCLPELLLFSKDVLPGQKATKIVEMSYSCQCRNIGIQSQILCL